MEIIQNFNGLELLFIIILAILLFGPERIPEIASKLGSFVRSIRTLSAQVMADLRKETGLDASSQEGRDLTASLQQTVSDVQSTMRSIRSPMNSMQKNLSGTPTPSGAASESKSSLQPESPSGKSREELEKKLHNLEKQLKELQSELAQANQPPEDIADE